MRLHRPNPLTPVRSASLLSVRCSPVTNTQRRRLWITNPAQRRDADPLVVPEPRAVTPTPVPQARPGRLRGETNHSRPAEGPGRPGVSLPAPERGVTILPRFPGEVQRIPAETEHRVVSEAIFYVYIHSGAQHRVVGVFS